MTNIQSTSGREVRIAYPGVDMRPIEKISRVLIMRAWLRLLMIDCRLKFTGFESVQNWIVKAARLEANHKNGIASSVPWVIDEVSRVVQIASKFYYRIRRDCLPAGMLAFYLMRRRGLPVELCIGVRKFPFKAHAWVELEGHIVFTTPADVAKYKVIMKMG